VPEPAATLLPRAVVDHRVGVGATVMAVVCGWLLATRQSAVVPYSLGLTPVVVAWFAAGLLLVMCWCAGQRIAAPHRTTALLVMAGTLGTLMSCAALMLRGPAAEQAGQALSQISREACLLAAAVLVLVVVRTTAELTRVVQGIVIGASVSAVLALGQLLTGMDGAGMLVLPGLIDQSGDLAALELLRAGVLRPRGSAAHPLELSAVLTVCLPLALGLTFAQRSRGLPHRFWAVLGLLIAVGAVATISRSAVIGAVAALAVMSWRWPVRRVVLGGCAVVAAATVAVVGGLPIATRLADVFVGGSEDGSLGSRSSGLAYALERLPEHWLFGQGAGTYDVARQPVLDNHYLTRLVEAGLVGLGCLLVMVVGAWVVALRASRRAAGSADAGAFELVNGVLGALTAVIVIALILDIGGFAQISNLLYVLIALAGASALATSTTTTTSEGAHDG
jgi:putative inorganic carbon (HCO3(-)) transporter